MRYEPEPKPPRLAEWGVDDSGLAKPDKMAQFVTESAAREGMAIMTERLAQAEERVAIARERQLAALQQIAALEAAHPIAAADDGVLLERRPPGRASAPRRKEIAAGG